MASGWCLERAPLSSLFVEEKRCRHLKCQICCEVMEKAYMLPTCQHTACLPCWQKVGAELCPYCRAPFQERELVMCRYLAGSLAEARVRCPFSCGWVGEHKMMVGHEGSCPILNVAALQEEVKARDELVGKLQQAATPRGTEFYR